MKNYSRSKGTAKQVRYRTPSRFIIKKSLHEKKMSPIVMM